MRRRLHWLGRRHYWFDQGTTEFYICAPRFRWGRKTEYTIAVDGYAPVRVTYEQFVNLRTRLENEEEAS